MKIFNWTILEMTPSDGFVNNYSFFFSHVVKNIVETWIYADTCWSEAEMICDTQED